MKHTYLLFFVITFGCQPSTKQGQEQSTKSSIVQLFENGEPTGKVDKLIDEASGLEVSRANPGHLWTHNDSGDKPRLFLIDKSANLKAIVNLEGIKNRDWEDITLGTDSLSGKNYIYIAEIGDNYAQYEKYYIYKIEEPKLNLGSEVVEVNISDIETTALNYIDGNRDAETLMIDELTNDLYIISKREKEIGVYLLQYPYSNSQINILPKLGTIPFTNFVAGDISTNREILVKNYNNIFYWKIKEGTSIFETMLDHPVILPYVREEQGETIAWSDDNKGYYTLSEKGNSNLPNLLFYKRNN